MSQLVLAPNGTGATNMFLDCLWIAGIGNFSRAGDCDFQYLADRNFGVSRAGGRDFDGFGLETTRI